MSQKICLAVLGLLSVCSLTMGDAESRRAEVTGRIAPLWSHCLQGDSCATAPVITARSGAARSGQALYGAYCITCHATGVADAPMLGDALAWRPRAALGLQALLEVTINGKGGMPAKGLCMDCSDAELNSAIEYMLAESR